MFDTSKLRLGEQVRVKRVLEKKTQKQLARETGVAQQYLSMYEMGRLSFSEEHKQKLTEYVNAEITV